MSASLVGSEMCIRDSTLTHSVLWRPRCRLSCGSSDSGSGYWEAPGRERWVCGDQGSGCVFVICEAETKQCPAAIDAYRAAHSTRWRQ
eukprot:1444974-Alexandrium_andersonii.AAC.1